MILHDVPYYATFVEVAAATLGAKVLFERDGHRGDVIAIPRRRNEAVAEAKYHQILHHFLAQVVVDAIDLLLGEQPCEMLR